MALHSRGLYYETLETRNLIQLESFLNKLVPYIVDHKYTYFDKMTILLRNL